MSAFQGSGMFHKQCEKDDKNNALTPDVPFHPGPVYRPPPKPIRHGMSNQQGSKVPQA